MAQESIISNEPSVEAMQAATAALNDFNDKVAAGLVEFDAAEAQRIAKEKSDIDCITIAVAIEAALRDLIQASADDENPMPITVHDMWVQGRTVNILAPDRKHGFQAFVMANVFAGYELDSRGISRACQKGHAVSGWTYVNNTIGYIAQCQHCKRTMIRDMSENVYGELLDKNCTHVPPMEKDLPF